MNKEQLQQKIAFYFERLSPAAQEVFAKMDWLGKLESIGRLYALSDAQMETLSTETTLALLGIIHLDDFEKNLTHEMHLPRLTLDKILIEINNSIISPIRGDLSDAFEANVSANTPEMAAVETKLDDRFATLPKEIQDILTQVNYYGNLYAVGEENSLSVSQMGLLEEVVTDIVTGKSTGENLAEDLRRRIGLSDETVSKLTNDINEKILRKIRKAMMLEDKSPATDHAVLQDAGIEVIDGEQQPKKAPEMIIIPKPLPDTMVAPVGEQKVDLTRPELPPGDVASPATPALPKNILGEKFGNTFKMETKKFSAPKSYQGGEDPYREKPE